MVMGLGGIGDEEIVWVRFEPQPPLVAAGLKDRWHAIVDSRNQLV
jgi:hypothetical protein